MLLFPFILTMEDVISWRFGDRKKYSYSKDVVRIAAIIHLAIYLIVAKLLW